MGLDRLQAREEGKGYLSHDVQFAYVFKVPGLKRIKGKVREESSKQVGNLDLRAGKQTCP